MATTEIVEMFDNVSDFSENFVSTKKIKRARKNIRRAQTKILRAFDMSTGELKCKVANRSKVSVAEEGSGGFGSDIERLMGDLRDTVQNHLAKCTRYQNYNNLIRRLEKTLFAAAEQVDETI